MPAFANLTRYLERRLISPAVGVTFFEWFTPWMTADGIDNIRSVLKSKNSTGVNFQWQPAIQYAPVRADLPGTPATLGSQQTGDTDYSTGDIPVSTNMGSNRLFRLGVAFSSSINASTPQQADVCLQASWKQVGTDLGTRRVTLITNDTSTRYEVLTPWRPATLMSKVKAAFTMTSITGTTANLKYQLAYQTATATVQTPGSWVNAEGVNWRTPSGANDERNTGEIALTTTDMWFRLGVAYALTTGTTATTAVLDAFLACR